MIIENIISISQEIDKRNSIKKLRKYLIMKKLSVKGKEIKILL